MCSFSANDEHELEKHRENRCDICHHGATDQNDLLVHVAKHKGKLNCLICRNVFRSKHNLSKHRNLHVSSTQIISINQYPRSNKYNFSIILKKRLLLYAHIVHIAHVMKKTFSNTMKSDANTVTMRL